MFLTAQGGILGPFAWILGVIFEFIYNILADENGIANLGICIIVFTVVVKLILFPLTLKQQKASKINMMIQPELQKVQNKYKDKKDQESMLKQQQEMQEVYDKYGTSMTGGCLTAFIQLPIIYALYRVIQKIPAYVDSVYNMYKPIATGIFNSQGADKIQQFMIDYVAENKISGANYAMNSFQKLSEVGINDVVDAIANFGVSNLQAISDQLGLDVSANIQQIDQIHQFCGINISEAPGYHLSIALLIPILSALFQFLSMQVSMSKQPQMEGTSGAMMKSMQLTMPIMSLVFCISLPAGIGIYWTASAFITMVTQIIVNIYYDHADMDEILAKQMEKAAIKREKNGGKKSFMQRMMDTSAEAQEQLEKQQAIKRNSAASLKNYVPSEESKKIVENKKNIQYKEGSIGAKANIMMNYNHSKEDK